MVNTAELRQIFPLRENTLRHVVEGDGRYPRAMTPSVLAVHHLLLYCLKVRRHFKTYNIVQVKFIFSSDCKHWYVSMFKLKKTGITPGASRLWHVHLTCSDPLFSYMNLRYSQWMDNVVILEHSCLFFGYHETSPFCLLNCMNNDGGKSVTKLAPKLHRRNLPWPVY